jgi:hypothetical protein
MLLQMIELQEIQIFEVSDEALELSSGIESLGGIESSVATCSNSSPRC